MSLEVEIEIEIEVEVEAKWLRQMLRKRSDV